jgi:hypothetical protein
MTYEEQESSADELRDAVVEELEQKKEERRHRRSRQGVDPFSGTGFCSADNICH